MALLVRAKAVMAKVTVSEATMPAATMPVAMMPVAMMPVERAIAVGTIGVPVVVRPDLVEGTAGQSKDHKRAQGGTNNFHRDIPSSKSFA